MFRNKAVTVVLLCVFGIAVIYNLRSCMRRSAEKERRGQQIQISTPVITGRTGSGVSVGSAYILIEKYEELLEHEIKGSTRNPFAQLKGEVPARNVEVIQPAVTTPIEPRIDQRVETVSKEEETVAKKPPHLEKRKEENSEKLQPQALEKLEQRGLGASAPSLEIKGILVNTLGKSVIIDDHVYSEGDYIGEERLVEIKPDSVVLEKEGGKRELKLKQSPALVKVRRLK